MHDIAGAREEGEDLPCSETGKNLPCHPEQGKTALDSDRRLGLRHRWRAPPSSRLLRSAGDHLGPYSAPGLPHGTACLSCPTLPDPYCLE